MIMTIFAQLAGHQNMVSTRIPAAIKKRQKHNFIEITSSKDSVLNFYHIKSTYSMKKNSYCSKRQDAQGWI